MNKGDAYILDIGEAFFVWNGHECSRTERIKVATLVSLVHHAVVVVVDIFMSDNENIIAIQRAYCC